MTTTQPSTSEPALKRARLDGEDGGDGSVATKQASEESLEAPVESNASTSSSPSTTKAYANPTEVSISEEEAGVLTYVNPDLPGFRGVIKQRFSDFMVNEVDLSGQILHLTNYEVPKLSESQKQQQAVEEPVDDDEAGTKELLEILNGDTDTVEVVKKILEDGGADKSLSVTTQVITDKAQRTKVHKCIQKYFGKRLVSETSNEAIAIRWMTKDAQRQQRRPARGPGPDWKQLGGDFCTFLLYKENRDTMDAVSMISKFLRVSSKNLSYAGTKDKRAVTVQRVSAYRVKPENLKNLNKKLQGMRVGNFSYEPKKLSLGDLRGNHFVICLRDVFPSCEESISKSISTLHTTGFINYYGMQRFGTRSISTHEVGIVMLKGQWKEAVDMILGPKKHERGQYKVAREHWIEHQDPQKALELFPKTCLAERSILTAYMKNSKTDHFAALGSIPRNLRMMYIHAYQSLVWNHMATERIRLYGCKPVIGDLVLNKKAEDALSSSPATDEPVDVDAEDTPMTIAEDEASTEARTDTNVPLTETADEATTTSTSNSEESATPATASSSASTLLPLPIRSDALVTVIETEEQAATYSIEDIVLPLPGYDVQYPRHAIAEKYKEFMAQHGLDPHNMRRKQRDYSLSGSYRKLIGVPKNFGYKFIRYNDPSVPLMRTDLDIANGTPEPESVPDGKYLALVLEFTLETSQYATMALREVMKMPTSAAHHTTLNQPGSTPSAQT